MGTPTGTVYNSTSGFIVTKKGKSGASIFLFDSLDGTISGWSPGVDMTRGVTLFFSSRFMLRFSLLKSRCRF